MLFQKSYDFYCHLYENLRTVPKRDRYTWGERSEKIALEILILSMRTEYSTHVEKKECLRKLSLQIDTLKVLLRLGDDLKIFDHKRYIVRSGELVEMGKMVGGWLKTLR